MSHEEIIGEAEGVIEDLSSLESETNAIKELLNEALRQIDALADGGDDATTRAVGIQDKIAEHRAGMLDYVSSDSETYGRWTEAAAEVKVLISASQMIKPAIEAIHNILLSVQSSSDEGVDGAVQVIGAAGEQGQKALSQIAAAVST